MAPAEICYRNRIHTDQMPVFVIVTPVLNGARYISETLSSISRQTDSDWIHYVVDGGSTDGTQDIVRATMASESRRRLIEGHDRGMYDAVFKGFTQAQIDGHGNSDSVCLWLNADDLLMPWALSTLRLAFVRTGADWITTLPCLWDAEGTLQLVSPFAWYPRIFIRWGLFHGHGLGWIQQESTFFTRRLLDRVPAAALDKIRSQKLAGDFLLWQEFARFVAPYPLPVAVSGFRRHDGNASTLQTEEYFLELRTAGVILTPTWLGSILRMLFRPVELFRVYSSLRRQVDQIADDEPAKRTSSNSNPAHSAKSNTPREKS
jgi:glycosyltransferase involved in cell wall biosynthesis